MGGPKALRIIRDEIRYLSAVNLSAYAEDYACVPERYARDILEEALRRAGTGFASGAPFPGSPVNTVQGNLLTMFWLSYGLLLQPSRLPSPYKGSPVSGREIPWFGLGRVQS